MLVGSMYGVGCHSNILVGNIDRRMCLINMLCSHMDGLEVI